MKKDALNNLLKNVQIIVRYCFRTTLLGGFFKHYFNLGKKDPCNSSIKRRYHPLNDFVYPKNLNLYI